MRSIFLTIAGFGAAALLWACYTPFAAYGLVHALGDPRNDPAQLESDLLAAGNRAHAALLRGLLSQDARVRLRCARVLALNGDQRGDDALLAMLRSHGTPGNEALGAQAEVFLLSVWNRRDGPPEGLARKLQNPEAFRTEADRLAALNETLARYPLWPPGYVERARIALRAGSVLEARLDALRALDLEPAEFDAMLVLGKCQLLLNAPDEAYSCYEQAVRVNPRLRGEARDDVREILKALESDRARRRRERRREMPVA